jgi:hypothetical protein
MTEPNMSLRSFERWQNSEAYQDYQAQYTGDLGPVVRRTKRYLRGSASDSDRRKVESFIARMKEQQAGKRRFGSGSSAVSARTCSLRNWGFDPTGRFS